MTLCTSIDQLAMAYLDDELADEELRELELHLRECAACRGRVEAEREELAQLRERLAAPPMPDVVRARLAAVLDTEDAAARQSRFTAWILPGTASLAAVAALALFVLLPREAAQPTAAKVARIGIVAPEVRVSPVSTGDHGVSVDHFARSHAELDGRQVENHLYRVRFGNHDERTIQASVFDARGLDLAIGQHLRVDGQELWVTPFGDRSYAVAIRNGTTGYVFTSPNLAPRDLIDIIVRFDLVRVSAEF